MCQTQKNQINSVPERFFAFSQTRWQMCNTIWHQIEHLHKNVAICVFVEILISENYPCIWICNMHRTESEMSAERTDTNKKWGTNRNEEDNENSSEKTLSVSLAFNFMSLCLLHVIMRLLILIQSMPASLISKRSIFVLLFSASLGTFSPVLATF